MKMNNVDMKKAAAFVEEVRKDPSKAVKAKKVEGVWNFEEGRPQFQARLEHTRGSTLIEADGPPFLGGSGAKPDPVQYCLFGLAACFAQTFASIAAERGVRLKELSVAVENQVNLLSPLGLDKKPIVEKVTLRVTAKSVDGKRLNEIKEEARERCPGVYCLTHPIQLEVHLNQ